MNALVSPTNVPNVYRVSFPLRDLPRQREDVVCFVRISEDGKLEINYCHTTFHARQSPSGTWNEHSRVRIELSPLFESLIRSNVSMALMDHFIGRVRMMPAEIGANLETIEW